LYNYVARLYDPVVGRFASADTVVPDLYYPQSLNSYSYCINNPLKYVDPSGHLLGAPNEDMGYLGDDIEGDYSHARGINSLAENGFGFVPSDDASVVTYVGDPTEWGKKENWDLSEESNPNFLREITLQFGLNMITGSILGSYKELGIYMNWDVEEGFGFGKYGVIGFGVIAGYTAEVNGTFSLSRNDPNNLGGLSIAKGVAVGKTSSPIGSPTIGVTKSTPFDNKSKETYSISVGWGIGSPVNANGFITGTAAAPF
jgi:hypothetical protein